LRKCAIKLQETTLKNTDTRDIIGGFALSAVGLYAAYQALDYEFGSLTRMGPGYFPVGLGLMLAVLGLVIAVPAFFRKGEPLAVEWRTMVLVLGSLVVFAASLKSLGLVAATVLAVVVSTFADRDTRWKGRLFIAGGVALVTFLVFAVGLSMILPIWPWST
jgi:hypothetical protein